MPSDVTGRRSPAYRPPEFDGAGRADDHCSPNSPISRSTSATGACFPSSEDSLIELGNPALHLADPDAGPTVVAGPVDRVLLATPTEHVRRARSRDATSRLGSHLAGSTPTSSRAAFARGSPKLQTDYSTFHTMTRPNHTMCDPDREALTACSVPEGEVELQDLTEAYRDRARARNAYLGGGRTVADVWSPA